MPRENPGERFFNSEFKHQNVITPRDGSVRGLGDSLKVVIKTQASSGLKTKKIPLFSGLFPVFFRPYSGIIPEKGRKKTGNRTEKERKHFPEKERNLISFKHRFKVCCWNSCRGWIQACILGWALEFPFCFSWCYPQDFPAASNFGRLNSDLKPIPRANPGEKI